MAETKTKIILFWGVFCIALFLSITTGVIISQNHTQAKVSDISINDPQVLGAYTSNIRGDTVVKTTAPITKTPILLPKISAKSYLVYDLQTGTQLFSKEPDTKLPIASLTKLITALIAYNTLDLNNYYIIPDNVNITTEPRLHIPTGEEVKGIDLFNAMLIGSENDVAKIFSVIIGQQTGNSFIDLMNQQAKDLGMLDSEFSNPMGFYSKDNYSTANDLKKLVDETQKYSAFTWVGKQQVYSLQTKTGNNFKAVTTNKLIKDHPDIFAIKTGYTKESLGSMITKINYKGHNVIIIVVASDNRENDTLNLKQLVEDNVMWVD